MSVVISRALVLILLGYGRRALAMIPTGPGPQDVFTAGQNCTIQWTTTAGAAWSSFDIDLMSGSNTNMTFVTNVTRGMDATNASASPFNWTCPEVEPYGKIYFYQFTSASNSSDTQWTTRFTILSPEGESEPPSHVSQGYGQYGTVPWGEGHLANSSASSSASIASIDSLPGFSTTTASKKTCRAHYMNSPEPEPSPYSYSEPETSASVTAFTIAAPAPEETMTRCSDCDEDPARRGSMLDSSAEGLDSEPWVRMSIGFLCVTLLVLAV